MKHIIGITGANGNLGSKFCKLFKDEFIIKKFKGDIRKKNDIINWLNSSNFKCILHFAAIVPIHKVENNYSEALSINHLGTKKLINCIKQIKPDIEWFFYASTSHIYAPSKKKISETFRKKPTSKYGRSKLLGENETIKTLKNSRIKYAIGRIFSISDNKDNSFFINSLKERLKTKKKIIILNNLNHYRDFLITDQICRIIYKLYKKKFNGVINIGSGKKTYLKNIAINLSKNKGKKIFFNDNKNQKSTSIIANISKLKKVI